MRKESLFKTLAGYIGAAFGAGPKKKEEKAKRPAPKPTLTPATTAPMVKVTMPNERWCMVDTRDPKSGAKRTRSQVRGEAKKLLGISRKGRLPVGTSLISW